MKVLLSGANGSFGLELTKYLDNYDTISLRYGEFTEQQKIQLEECEVFIHIGALLNGAFDELFKANFLLTKDIFDFLNSHNPEVHFIYFSSMSVLKKKNNILHGDYLDFTKMTDYAVSKYLCEIISSRYKIPLTILRFSTLFYQNPQKDGLSKLVYDACKNNKITIYNNGVAKRDFIPLDIAAKYVVKIIENEELINQTLNIASGYETSFKNIADYLQNKIINLNVENVYLEVEDTVPTDFNDSQLDSIGRIEFNLHEKIDEYFEKLSKK